MKALYFEKHGTFTELRFGEVPPPVIKSDEVLVRVRCAAINHLDLFVLAGWPGLKLAFPHVGGADICGEIVEVGDEAIGRSRGEEVVICPGYAAGEDEWTRRGEECVSPTFIIFGEDRPGGFAEFIAVPAKTTFPKPPYLSDTEAAAGLLVSLTAWRMLVHRAKLAPGETVLVVGAGGGVNSMAIQLAHHLGASVIALTSSEKKLEQARLLGANHALNYHEHPEWSREVRRLTGGRGADVIVDNVGKATFDQSLRSAARGGRIVTVGNTSGHEVSFDNRLVFAKQLSILGSTMGSRRQFEEVQSYMLTKEIRPVISEVLDFADGRRAYEILSKGEQFGKVVLRVS